MARNKHYEVWVQTGESRWEMASLFADLELANAAAGMRERRVRLIEVLSDGSNIVSQELVQEIRATQPAA